MVVLGGAAVSYARGTPVGGSIHTVALASPSACFSIQGSLSLSPSHTLWHTLTHDLALSLTHSLAHTHTRSRSLFHTLSGAHSHTLSLSHSLTLWRTLTHALALLHTSSHGCGFGDQGVPLIVCG